MRLADRMGRLGTETAFLVLARARELEAQGRSICHLEIGEPDFDTPGHIVAAAQQALDDGYTHYGPAAGDPELRAAIARYAGEFRGVSIAAKEVVVVPGAKPILFFALLALLVIVIQRFGILEQSVTVEHLHDLGKLTFGFIVFWAYIAFSQYMLIWYANLPEETGWYERRQEGAWMWASLVLLVGHFFVPFLFLMSKHVKRRKGLLAAGAC